MRKIDYLIKDFGESLAHVIAVHNKAWALISLTALLLFKLTNVLSASDFIVVPVFTLYLMSVAEMDYFAQEERSENES